MRSQPIWKQDQAVPGDILAQMIGETPIIAELEYKVDPRKPRYIFNPFRNRRLDPWYQGMYNLMQNFIPERMILPLTIGYRPDIDYNAMRTDGLEASERYVTPAERSKLGSEMKDFERLPVHNAISMVSEYSRQFGMPTGFCQIEELDGVEDFGIALRVTRRCFPNVRTTVDADLEHIEKLIDDQVQDEPIVRRIFQALSENKLWAEEHVRRLVNQLDDYAGGRQTGKPRADRLDIAVCGWLGVPIPKTASKTSVGGDQQSVRVEMVPGAAVETGPQIQCAECGEFCNLLPDGNPPRMCKGCRTPFTVEAGSVKQKPPQDEAGKTPTAKTSKKK